ncbi:hypothetical protein XENORESO_014890 [Xenotaenia resolanae]|uniref:Uncharacterized protein n=1 Tax=Xenotaenia resolanae TaxID=208358 RepID=A0ABV0VT12_9TELE
MTPTLEPDIHTLNTRHIIISDTPEKGSNQSPETTVVTLKSVQGNNCYDKKRTAQAFPRLLRFYSCLFPLPFKHLCKLSFPLLLFPIPASLFEQVWHSETGRQRHWCVTVPMATTS